MRCNREQFEPAPPWNENDVVLSEKYRIVACRENNAASSFPKTFELRVKKHDMIIIQQVSNARIPRYHVMIERNIPSNRVVAFDNGGNGSLDVICSVAKR